MEPNAAGSSRPVPKAGGPEPPTMVAPMVGRPAPIRAPPLEKRSSAQMPVASRFLALFKTLGIRSPSVFAFIEVPVISGFERLSVFVRGVPRYRRKIAGKNIGKGGQPPSLQSLLANIVGDQSKSAASEMPG